MVAAGHPYRIPMTSRMEAMDLSLVLLSQGTESVIEHSEGNSFALVISSEHGPGALETIRQYYLENCGRISRRRNASIPQISFDWMGLILPAILFFFYYFQQTHAIESQAVLSPGIVAAGQWWRIFTAMTLHADVSHLVGNAILGTLFLGLAMGEFGVGASLLLSFLAGGIGNLVSLAAGMVHPFFSLGASGMVMGSLGLLAAANFRRSRQGELKSSDFAGLFSAIFVLLFLGLSPGSNVVAHVGGFAGGFVLGIFFAPFFRRFESPLRNFLAALVFLFVLLISWRFALRLQ